MIKATDISIELKHSYYFVDAMVNDLSYQQKFYPKPNQLQVDQAVKSFEDNYAGLNESNNKPVKIAAHHYDSE